MLDEGATSGRVVAAHDVSCTTMMCYPVRMTPDGTVSSSRTCRHQLCGSSDPLPHMLDLTCCQREGFNFEAIVVGHWAMIHDLCSTLVVV